MNPKGSESPPNIVWVHNFPTHYTVRLFELVAKLLPAEFLFFSGGRERYWLRENGVAECGVSHENLRGVVIFGTRFVWALPWRLMRKKYDALVQCIDGRFALPVSYLAARIRRRPFVLYTGLWMRVDTMAHRLVFPLLRHIYRHADALVVYGEHVKRYLVAEGVPPSRIFVEPHAVDNSLYNRRVAPEEIRALRESLEAGSNKLILNLGRMEPEKGLDHLIRAFAEIEDVHSILVLAGLGSEEQRLRALAARLGVGHRVRWPGYVPLRETASYYAVAWVFVLPSVTTRRDKEAWGLVVNEAFNQALPVIASDAVGAAAGGLIEDGVNGMIVPEGNASALAQALNAVLSGKGVRDRLGESARRKIEGWNQESAAAVVERAVRFATRREPANPIPHTIPSAGDAYIVIPVHNRAAFTLACLQGLDAQTVRGFHIIVVDDGSTDGTSQMIRTRFPDVILLAGDGALWWSKATNLGTAEALKRGAAFVIMLNDDTIPERDFVESMLRSSARAPGALIGSFALDAVTGEEVYGGERINWLTASPRNLLESGNSRDGLVESTHAPGRGLLVPAQVFARVGLLDAVHFPQNAGDYDFTHRARRAGYRIYCDYSSVIRCYPQASFVSRCRARKGWGNYRRHLFDIRGGGNLRVFFWFAVRNCPKALLPVYLTVGLARRVTGYLLEWFGEAASARRKAKLIV